MAGTSRINPRRQSGLQHLFDIRDPQTNPELVDMSMVQPVIDMSMQGFARLYDPEKMVDCSDSVSIAGIQTKTIRILSYGNAVGVDKQIVVPESHHFCPFGSKFTVQTNAAGAAAWNGKYMTLEVSLYVNIPNVGYNRVTKFVATDPLNTGIQTVVPGSYQAPDNLVRLGRVVPATSYMEMTIWMQDGTNFPAATTFVYSICGLAVPIGAPLPFIG